MDDNPRERLSNSLTPSLETEPYWLIFDTACCPFSIYSNGLFCRVSSVAL